MAGSREAAGPGSSLRGCLGATQPPEHDIERRTRRGTLAEGLLHAPGEQPLPDPPGVQAGEVSDLGQQTDRVSL